MTTKVDPVHIGNRKIKVTYLDLPLTEVKVQHALGTAIWHIHMFSVRKSHFIVPVISPNPTSAVYTAEKHYADSIAYQVDEVTTQ